VGLQTGAQPRGTESKEKTKKIKCYNILVHALRVDIKPSTQKNIAVRVNMSAPRAYRHD
jgi:hypothetical protein